jgi:hypothetical protein
LEEGDRYEISVDINDISKMEPYLNLVGNISETVEGPFYCTGGPQSTVLRVSKYM